MCGESTQSLENYHHADLRPGPSSSEVLLCFQPFFGLRRTSQIVLGPSSSRSSWSEWPPSTHACSCSSYLQKTLNVGKHWSKMKIICNLSRNSRHQKPTKVSLELLRLHLTKSYQVTLSMTVEEVVELLVDLLLLTVLPQQTPQHTLASHPQDLGGHAGLAGSLALSSAHVATLALGFQVLAHAGARMHCHSLSKELDKWRGHDSKSHSEEIQKWCNF